MLDIRCRYGNIPIVRTTDLAWAAGLFEGEGCFFYARPSKAHRYGVAGATLAMTDLDIVERFAEVMGFGLVRKMTNQGPPTRKQMYVWRAGGFEHVQATAGLLWKWLGPRRREQVRFAFTSFNAFPRTRQKHGRTDRCIVEDCETMLRDNRGARGLCGKHYQRLRLWGDVRHAEV